MQFWKKSNKYKPPEHTNYTSMLNFPTFFQCGFYLNPNTQREVNEYIF